jgi:hypothetical protein
MVLTNITQIYDPVSATWSYGPNMNMTEIAWTAAGNDSIVAPADSTLTALHSTTMSS